MSNNIGQALDLTNLVVSAKKEAQEEMEARAIVGDLSDIEKAKQIPTPSGYRILCAIPEEIGRAHV